MSDKRPAWLSFIRPPLTGSIRLARPARLASCVALALVLSAARLAHAQSQAPLPRAPIPPSIGQSSESIDDRSEPDQVDAARRLRVLSDMRQKAIVSDTNKLLKLASELDAEIQQANSDSLTPDQLRKLATIEKLARNIKEKMSNPVQGTPVYPLLPMPAVH